MRAALAIIVALSWLGAAKPSLAHPHVFVDGRMEITGDGHGHLTGLTNVWAMDELFSASVIPDFDKNANGKLDPGELAAVASQVRTSIAEWSFYTFLKSNGHEVPLDPPKDFRASWETASGKLIFRFDLTPQHPVDLKGADVTVSNFDKTYFVAFDFPDDSRFALRHLPASCHKRMVTPTPDEAEKIWQDTMAALGPADSTPPEDGINFSEALATRVEIDCRS
ncbi:DUF1007 family protein [Mangrovicella endophytica]|uniref:DUF1007 family protein n=1 Tax=Mangrovicella endophytica TaxID=2066697 RepID=UPI0012FFDD31|nr:DUF1007 family protein [Mangrovicella endophytica]